MSDPSAVRVLKLPVHYFRFYIAYTLTHGWERASTTRMRERRQICCNCKVTLEPPPARERYRTRCEPKHRVYMHFMLRDNGWYCQFLMDDLKASLRWTFTFQDPQKLVEMAERGGAVLMSAERQAMEYGIQQGRGAVWLNLTSEQLGKLR